MLAALAAARLDGRLAASEPLTGGLTDHRVERLTLEDGRCFVLKAAPPPRREDLVHWREVLRDEIDAYSRYPELNPWRPDSLAVFDHDGWLVWLLEDVGDERPDPAITARALADLHGTTVHNRPPTRVHADNWAKVVPRVRGGLPAGLDTPAFWTWFHRAQVAGSDAIGRHAKVPYTSVHGDLRPSHALIHNGRVKLIDWQLAWDSPATDTTYWAIGIELEGGGEASQVHRLYERAGGSAGDGLGTSLAAWAGFYMHRLQSKGSPREVLELQAVYLPPTLRWMASELGLPEPPISGS